LRISLMSVFDVTLTPSCPCRPGISGSHCPRRRRRRDGNDLDALASVLQLHPGRLTIFVEFVTERRHLKRRRDDRVIDKPHSLAPFAAAPLRRDS
jgi:hypothetical protein